MQILETSKHPILRLACPQTIIQLKLRCHTDGLKHNFNIFGFKEKNSNHIISNSYYHYIVTDINQSNSYQFLNLTGYLL